MAVLILIGYIIKNCIENMYKKTNIIYKFKNLWRKLFKITKTIIKKVSELNKMKKNNIMKNSNLKLIWL